MKTEKFEEAVEMYNEIKKRKAEKSELEELLIQSEKEREDWLLEYIARRDISGLHGITRSRVIVENNLCDIIKKCVDNSIQNIEAEIKAFEEEFEKL